MVVLVGWYDRGRDAVTTYVDERGQDSGQDSWWCCRRAGGAAYSVCPSMLVLLHTLQCKVNKYTESNGLPSHTTLMHECTRNQYAIVARVNIKHED